MFCELPHGVVNQKATRNQLKQHSGTLFFKNINIVDQRNGPIPPERRWNCGRSGLSTVQIQVKIVASRVTRHQVENIIS